MVKLDSPILGNKEAVLTSPLVKTVMPMAKRLLVAKNIQSRIQIVINTDNKKTEVYIL